jgi:ubiquinone biosynthesis protein COQ4
MATTTLDAPIGLARLELEIPPPPVAPRIQWRRAWRAMQMLIQNPDRTELAFETIAALSGHDWERLFQRFAADPDGRSLLAERPSLLVTLSDREALRALPEGSFGRTYAEFMDAAQLTPEGLVEAEMDSMAAAEVENLDPLRAYLSDRTRDIHDLWHVLTGYGRDEAGEAANLAFSYAQLGLHGMALIVFGIVLSGAPDGSTRPQWLRYMAQAWRRGRQTAWLPPVHYEDLLALPLDEVRRILKIPSPRAAHGRDVIVANGVRPAVAST